MDTWADKTQGATSQIGAGIDYNLSLKRDSLYLDRESQLDSQVPLSGLSAYGQDPTLGGLRSSTLGRTAAAMVTQVHFSCYCTFFRYCLSKHACLFFFSLCYSLCRCKKMLFMDVD